MHTHTQGERAKTIKNLLLQSNYVLLCVVSFTATNENNNKTYIYESRHKIDRKCSAPGMLKHYEEVETEATKNEMAD